MFSQPSGVLCSNDRSNDPRAGLRWGPATLGTTAVLVPAELALQCRDAAGCVAVDAPISATVAADMIEVREVPLSSEPGMGLPKAVLVAADGNLGFSFQDFWPAGTETPSSLAGTTSEERGRQRPEVLGAQPVLDNAFDRNSASIYMIKNKIIVTPDAIALLRNYFETKPSDFGDQLIAAVESENLQRVAAVLKQHGLFLFAEAKGTVSAVPIGVGKVETRYRLETSGMEEIYQGWLATPEKERTALVFSGVQASHPFGGHTTFDLANGRPIAVVDADVARAFAVGAGFSYERVLAAFIANESMHLEQYNRWGRNAFVAHISPMELMSDARMVGQDPELGATVMLNVIWQNQLGAYGFRKTNYGDSAALLAAEYKRLTGGDLIGEIEAAIKQARAGDEQAIGQTLERQETRLADPTVWQEIDQAFSRKASLRARQLDRKVLPAHMQ